MSRYWTYTDIYEVIVRYIQERLVPQNFTLNFSVIALCQTAPKVHVRLTLKNLANNRSEQWETQLIGNTVQELNISLHTNIERYREHLEG